MLDEGATIIDFGACSSRPGSEPVGPEEEWNRLEPVLTEVKEMWPDLEVSIDTNWSYVVEKAYDILGKFIVNDISAGEDDPQMLRNLRKFRRPYPSCPRPKVLVGVSRKSMIYKPLSITPEESLPQTQVLHLKALQEGADMLRVHDIAEAKRTVEVYWRLC